VPNLTEIALDITMDDTEDCKVERFGDTV